MKVIANRSLTCGDVGDGQVFGCDVRHFTRVCVIGILTRIPMCKPVLEVLYVQHISQFPTYPARSAVDIALTGMKKVLWPTIWLSAVALLAAGFASISKMGFWWSFLIVAGAMLINGWVATFEDDLPGGFNNPDGTSTPRYAIGASWGLRAPGAVLALLFVGMLALHFFGTP